MKLEILKKLIALANNNPNDNEANLAARKVCKALIEDKFVEQLRDVAVPPHTAPPKPNTRPTPQYYETWGNPFGGAQSSYWDDIFGGASRQYVREEEARKAEAEKRKQARQAEEKRDKERGYRKGAASELLEREKSWQKEQYNNFNSSYYNPITKTYYVQMFQDAWFEATGTRHHSDNYEFRQRRSSGYKDVPRKLKCKTCGKIVETKFMGLEQVFECNECTWDFQKKSHNFKKTCNDCKTPVTCTGFGYCTARGTNL